MIKKIKLLLLINMLQNTIKVTNIKNIKIKT